MGKKKYRTDSLRQFPGQSTSHKLGFPVNSKNLLSFPLNSPLPSYYRVTRKPVASGTAREIRFLILFSSTFFLSLFFLLSFYLVFLSSL